MSTKKHALPSRQGQKDPAAVTMNDHEKHFDSRCANKPSSERFDAGKGQRAEEGTYSGRLTAALDFRAPATPVKGATQRPDRIPKACVTCRERKIKCGGEYPCQPAGSHFMVSRF